MQEANLYTVTVPVFAKALTSLDNILEKLVHHASTKASERRPTPAQAEALLHSRLVFDQFPFVQQVQVACDNAKNGAARLAGVEAPKYEDTEKTIEELEARIEKTLDFLQTIKPEQIIGKESNKIALPYWKGKHLTAFEYATQQLLPNFFFHFTTAYAILRKNGVAIGKNDFIGELPLKD